MKQFIFALKIILIEQAPPHLKSIPTSELLYRQLLQTLLMIALFGLGILFAFRFFGTIIFSTYFLLSWLFFAAIIPKAMYQHIVNFPWDKYMPLPISEFAWKTAQLTQFSLIYGASLFAPLTFLLIWSFIQQSLFVFCASMSIWCIVILLTYVSITYQKHIPSQYTKYFHLVKTSLFWIFILLGSYFSIHPNSFQAFTFLQTWLTPDWYLSQLTIFIITLLLISYCLNHWSLTSVPLNPGITSPSFNHHWLFQYQKKLWKTAHFLSQWLTNIWLLLIAVLLWLKMFSFSNSTWEFIFATFILFFVFGIFSPAACQYSLMDHDRHAFHTLPFPWIKDFKQKTTIVFILTITQLLVFSLCSVFILDTPQPVIGACITQLPLLYCQTQFALINDYVIPKNNWQSVVHLLRPTWTRFKTIAIMLTCILIFTLSIQLFFSLFVSFIFAVCLSTLLWLSIIHVKSKKILGHLPTTY